MLGRLLSGLAYKITRSAHPRLKNALIRMFIRIYNIDTSLAARAAPQQFRSFNDFFTRELKPDARPIHRTVAGLVSPADATVSALGEIDGDRLFQAKGKNYSLEQLLCDNGELSDLYRGGSFITLYLSPGDYHRVHIPADGELRAMTYVPGSLFSVNPATVARVDRLFARNERVLISFDSPLGVFSLILVGAVLVGSMATVWHGEITPAAERKPRSWRYEPGITFKQGDEIGRFNMGSTALVLTQAGKINWSVNAGPVRMGQQIAVPRQR